MMVNAESERRSRKPLVILVVLLLLAAGGAAAYFKLDAIKELVGMNKADNTQRAPSNIPAPARPDAGSSAPQPATQVNPNLAGSRPAADGSGQPSASQPAGSAGSTGASDSASGGRPLFSLQAASFPNEKGARDYSERLIRAGVPAYVVAADIPKRGRWYRVRAGKFATQEETRKYASEWQQRMRAAGIKVELVSCDYTQP
jgi:cell division septation protein DedD